MVYLYNIVFVDYLYIKHIELFFSLSPFVLRRDNLDMTRRGSQTKVFDTFTVVTGAMTLSLVKGPILLRGKSHGRHGGSVTLFGTGCILVGCLSIAIFTIIKVSYFVSFFNFIKLFCLTISDRFFILIWY